MNAHQSSLLVALNDYDPAIRQQALRSLAAMRRPRSVARDSVNLHSHTFYSFNGYGYSPVLFAWKAADEGLYAAGIVDFDVLDGVEDFLEACAVLGVRGCAGMETRVFVPELGDVEINSPGEPGIAYHMGSGFVRSTAHDTTFLHGLKAAAQARTRMVCEKVNAFLDPVRVDFDSDVLPRTPMGNATERHLCEAYDVKAAEIFPQENSRIDFWSGKLGVSAEDIRRLSAEPPLFHAMIRSKTMKRGGAGYVRPDSEAFPRLADVNAFVLGEGAIPTCTWLDGCSVGESDPDQLLDLHEKHGSLALNIIPDRNWNIPDPVEKARRVAHLDAIIEAARSRHLALLVGTEMNAYGQRFVDDFTAPAMRPHRQTFMDGASVLHAHTRLAATASMGYVSPWADAHFASLDTRFAFYREVGERWDPAISIAAPSIHAQMTPEEVLAALTGR